MKKLILSTILFLSCLLPGFAQNLEWAKQIGSFSYDEGRGIAVDNLGNVYSAGTFYNTVDFDPGPGTTNLSAVGQRDIYITKMDANGNLIWARAVGGTATDGMTDLALDKNGNVLITGAFTSPSCDFDPGAGTYNLGTDGSNDIFVLKLDSAGNFVWAKRIGAGISTEVAYGIAVDTAGNAYTTGYITGSTDFDPDGGVYYLAPAFGQAAFVSKLGANGSFIWARLLEGTDNQTGYGIACDVTGNIYSTGTFETDIDMDPSNPGMNTFTCNGQQDVYISVFDPGGNYLWSGQLGAAGYDYAQNIYVSPQGELYAIGSTDGTIDADMGAGTFNLTATAGFDAYVLKMTTAGVTIWAKMYGDGAAHIATDAANNVYLAGAFSGTTDLDPGPGVANVVENGSTQDMYLSKLDAAGDFVWARSWGSTGYDYAWSMCTGYQSKIYMTGSFEQNIDMDPNAGTLNFTMAGGSDTYIMKINQCVTPPTVELGTDLSGCMNNYFIGVAGEPNVTYNWLSSPSYLFSTLPTVMVTPVNGLPYTYYLTANDTLYGCMANDSIHIDIDSISDIFLGPDFHSCSPINMTLGLPSEPNVIYSWTSNPPGFTDNTGDPIASPALDVTTTYYVQTTHTMGGCVKSDTIVLGYHSSPSLVGLGQTINFCANDTLHLADYVQAVGGTPPYFINWFSGFNNYNGVNPTHHDPLNPVQTFTISINDFYGCGANPGPLFTNVVGGASTDLLGHISIPSAGFVDAGTVYAFRYSPGNAGLNPIDSAGINLAGDYVFFGLDNDNYLIKAVANENFFPNSVPTYYGDVFQWDSSIVVSHGCIVNDTININVLETDPLDIGTGAISGYIIEEAGFGSQRWIIGQHPNTPFAPGGPLKGVDVKLGKNPGGGIQARTTSDSTGYYEFDSLPLRDYTIYVDIPNLPMDSTHQVSLSVGSEVSVQNNYFADSVNVYIIDTLVAVGIHASEKVYENNFTVFPNPAKDKLNVKFDAGKGGDVSITLMNALGQTVYEEQIKNNIAGTFTHGIEVSSLHLKAGVYFISVMNDGKKYTQRLVVM